MKRLVRMLTVCCLTLALSLGGFSVPVRAEENTKTEANGYFGDKNNLQWELKEENGEKILIVGNVTDQGDSIEKWANAKISPFKSICEDVDIIRFNGCKLTGKLDYMFAELKDLKTIEIRKKKENGHYNQYYYDITLDTSQATSMSHLFHNCSSLTDVQVSLWHNNETNEWDTTKVKDMSGMFYGCSKLQSIDIHDFNTSNVTDMSEMFYGCSSLESVALGNFGFGIDMSKVTDMSAMFSGCTNLSRISFDSRYNSAWWESDTSNVTDMFAMFYGCQALTTLDLSYLDTGKVTNMGAMFAGCSSLNYLDVSMLNTNSVKSMYGMFADCTSLKNLYLKKNNTIINTPNVTSMGAMFAGCSSLENLDLFGLNTDSVTDMRWMFAGCKQLRELNMSSFNTNNVQNLSVSEMLWDCTSLSEITAPKNMAEGQAIMLPALFMSSDDNSILVGQLTSGDCAKTFKRSAMEIKEAPAELYIYETVQLQLCIDEKALDYENYASYAWTSSDVNIATVSENGVVNAIAPGSVVISVAPKGEENIVGAKIELTVKPLDRVTLEINEINDLILNEEIALKVFVNDEEVDPKSMKWTSSDAEVATCIDGKLIGQKTGTTTITCTRDNATEATCEVTVVEALVIKSQPANQSVTEGDNAVFTVQAKGYMLNYQWQYKSPKGSTWENSGTTGAKTDSLTVQGLLVRDGQQYRCIITDGKGNQVTSNAVTLTVTEKLAITGQPTNQSVEEGNNAIFTVQAKGYRLNYQWQYKNVGTDKWINSGMTGARTDNLTVPGTMVRDGQQYRCIITDGKGIQEISKEVTLTVLKKLVITGQPTNQNVEEGNNAVFKVTADGSNISYQWQYKLPGGSTWSNSGATGAKTDSLTIQGLVVRNGQQYRCIITDERGQNVTSDAVTLTVTEKLAITGQPTNQYVEKGADAVFKVTAKGIDLSYQWQYKNANADRWFDSKMMGAKTDNLTVKGFANRDGQQYRCIITDGNGNTVTSDAVTLIVMEKLVITGQPASLSVTEGDNVVFKVTAMGTNLSYQWQYKLPGGSTWSNSGATGAKTESLTVQGLAVRNGQQYRCIITDAIGRQIISNEVTLTVEARLAIMVQPTNQSVAEGNNAVFQVEASGSDLSYQWQYKNAGTDKWFDSGMAGANTASLTVQGTVARNGQQYRCIITNGKGNTVTSNEVTLTVESQLVITCQPVNQSVTEGSNAVFQVEARGNNLSYQWQYKNVGVDKWINSGMAGAKTAGITVQGTAARNGQQYRCIITDVSGETVISDAVTLTVN